jgi:hypothetical protein
MDENSGAFRKAPDGTWAEIPHTAREAVPEGQAVDAGRLRDTLRAHMYQSPTAPGLYPEQPTVCSCGGSPPRQPEDEAEWWLDHVVTEATS